MSTRSPAVKQYRRLMRSLGMKRVRRALRKRDGNLCVLCRQGLGGKLSIDHVIPVSRGGTSHPENLRLVHHACNEYRQTHDGDAVSATDIERITAATNMGVWEAWQRLFDQTLGEPYCMTHCRPASNCLYA